jgi:starch phosphorylase
MLSPNQARIQSFRVVPSLPESLKPLMEIAHNLWWCWNYQAVGLFAKLDRELWERTHHNPVMMLGQIAQEKLDRAAVDRSFLHQIGLVHSKMREQLSERGWFDQKLAGEVIKGERPFKVAYFCAEFGLTECFQIYSGGLGGLAGDHLKSASDLGVPLVAVGLLYRRGYFHQYLNPDGWQQETYPDLDAPNQPIERVIDPGTKQPLKVHVEMPGRNVAIGIWRCNVGRISLYLLDTNLPENSREDRDITGNLYGGDIEMRIKQELVLGVGGVRALAALGEQPTVCHINEGHAAFIALERIANVRRKSNLTFDQAREAVACCHVFTTHTPVPAGIDRFPPRLVEQYLSPMLEPLGLDLEGLLALGRENTADRKEFFSMAVLAIRTSRFANGVSALHGHVSRNMWKHMWPGTPSNEIPIGHVTNGVHATTWLSKDFIKLYDRYLGENWNAEPQNPKVWQAINEIPDEELWSTHQRRREKLITWCRRKIRQQLISRGAGALEIEKAASALDMDTLTIGFARRFATYKRGTLLFRDLERVKKLLLASDRPIQLIVAGKSHPADGGGKQLIRDIVNFCRNSGCGHRVVFIEDYDMHVARRMVQGCDIWLNTPVRGLEASGTSGMKAAMNGCIHCSILDGWWDEGFGPEVGFSIGRGENYDEVSRDEMDDVESRSLYQVLESQVIPEFYDRDASGLPRRWIKRMKSCIREMAPRFNTHRQLVDYSKKFYIPAHNASVRLNASQFRDARELADHIDRYRSLWHAVRVNEASAMVDAAGAVSVRGIVKVQAKVALGQLAPSEVMVQLYHGRVTSLGELTDATPIVMAHAEDLGDGNHRYTGVFAPGSSGQHGFSVRVLPSDDRMVTPFLPGLITWDTGGQPVEAAPAPAPVQVASGH